MYDILGNSQRMRNREEAYEMFLVNQAMIDVPVGTAALIVVLGMAVVFFGLILLMYVTKITGRIMQNRDTLLKCV